MFRFVRKNKYRLRPALLLTALACLLCTASGAARLVHCDDHHHEHAPHSPETCAICHLIAAEGKSAVPESRTELPAVDEPGERLNVRDGRAPIRIDHKPPTSRGPPA